MGSNTRIVKVKQDRTCKFCKRVIPAGSSCLTTNKRGEGRRWVCRDCQNAIKRVAIAQRQLDLVPFGDEGGAMAAADYIDEVKGEFYERTSIWL